MQFRGTVYQIKATEGVQVLIPANLIGELKGLPEDVLSSAEAVSEVVYSVPDVALRQASSADPSQALLTKYTGFSAGHNGDLMTTLLLKRLTQNFARLVPRLREELEYITATEFPECKGRPSLSPPQAGGILCLTHSQTGPR